MAFFDRVSQVDLVIKEILLSVLAATLMWTTLILCLVNVLRHGEVVDAFMSGLACFALISYTKHVLDVKFWELYT